MTCHRYGTISNRLLGPRFVAANSDQHTANREQFLLARRSSAGVCGMWTTDKRDLGTGLTMGKNSFEIICKAPTIESLIDSDS